MLFSERCFPTITVYAWQAVAACSVGGVWSEWDERVMAAARSSLHSVLTNEVLPVDVRDVGGGGNPYYTAELDRLPEQRGKLHTVWSACWLCLTRPVGCKARGVRAQLHVERKLENWNSVMRILRCAFCWTSQLVWVIDGRIFTLRMFT